MKNKPTRESKTLWEKLTAPFRVLSVEKFYWFWVVSYFISFAGLLIDLLNHNFSIRRHKPQQKLDVELL